MHVGVAPLPVSSGQSNRHRLNRCGNRHLNSTIHMIALTQARMHPPAIAYMAGLPLEANVQFMTIMATKMPFIGRG